MKRELRPYQKASINAIKNEWSEGHKRTILCLPTGCGKTVVFNTLAKEEADNGKRVLVLAHRSELLTQAQDKYDGDTGLIKAEITDIKQVTVGSIQTLSRREWESNMFDVIIVDECHHAVSDSYQKFLQQFPNAYVLGCSATIDRSDKKSLATYFDSIAYEYTLRQAIKEGYLCPIQARTIPLEIDLSEVKVSVGDFEVNSIAEALEPYLPEIAENIKKYASDRKTVVFLPLISIAQEFTAILQSKGMNAREVNGMSADREEILEWFDKAPKGSVLCNAMLLTEGWDCPSVDCVVILRPTKVRALAVQMWGRGTRLYPGKENLLILDFLWLCQKHNLCRPANLVTDNEEDVKTVTKRTQDEQIDLFEAETDAVEQRKNALAEALRKQRRKKGKLIDPLTLFEMLDDIGLTDYEPTFKWEETDATDTQIKALEKFGVDAEGITKGYACKIMDTCIRRSKEGKATIKQVRCLKKFGYTDVPKWSFDQASKKINALAAVGWKRWRLHE